MSTSALMMIVREEDIGAVKLGSPQDLWNRLRSYSKGVILFRRLDANPERVKRDIDEGLELARKTIFNFGFQVGQVSSCLISATVMVMPVQAAWCPVPEEQVNQISPIFHYLPLLDPIYQKWHLYWWKLEEKDFGQHFWDYQVDPRLGEANPNLFDKDFYNVLDEFIYSKLP